jgi:hypothetical protein
MHPAALVTITVDLSANLTNPGTPWAGSVFLRSVNRSQKGTSIVVNEIHIYV